MRSDFRRHQVPYFAERYRIIAFDGLGNGGSDRPADPPMYGDLPVADDAIPVLDAPVIARLVEAAARCFEGMVIDRHEANGRCSATFSTTEFANMFTASARGESLRQDPRRVGKRSPLVG